MIQALLVMFLYMLCDKERLRQSADYDRLELCLARLYNSRGLQISRFEHPNRVRK